MSDDNTTTSTTGRKREREEFDVVVVDDVDDNDDEDVRSASTTAFRNVSACNRCRNRKNKCDLLLPRCSNCARARVACVGFDPIARREIPRSYVYYLESRVLRLEGLVRACGGEVPAPSRDFAVGSEVKPGENVPFPVRERDEGEGEGGEGGWDGTEGVSFAKVLFAAVQKTGRNKAKASGAEALAAAATTRDSFFGLHSKPTVRPAPFPDRELGCALAELYFEHANPQIPVLHRGEFGALLERVYAAEPKLRTPRQLYLLNIVFAIGSGIIMDSAAAPESDASSGPERKKARLDSSQQRPPEEYHAAAVVHLENFLTCAPACSGVGSGLEELQAVLLLASLALLRPVAPGLWYIIGVAVRLSVDLGLHVQEPDREGLDTQPAHPDVAAAQRPSRSRGRKQWTRDLGRRLWWCVYNLDRLVSSCVGRPVSISEAVVTTAFPSLLDDAEISPSGFRRAPDALPAPLPSYKLVSRHYIRLRLLQSEILQVLQHRAAETHGSSAPSPRLPSPFLAPFASFRSWRADVDRRLALWIRSAPRPETTGVRFNPLFFELNYWQAVIMLYRPALAVPQALADEAPAETRSVVDASDADVDDGTVFVKVARAGQTVLKLYRQLHRLKLVNYTFLATHHLFTSGISFLYALWHSQLVRARLSLDDVDFTVLAATSVLSDLGRSCAPAEACRDAFARMSKATIAMVMEKGGFGQESTLGDDEPIPCEDEPVPYGEETLRLGFSSHPESAVLPPQVSGQALHATPSWTAPLARAPAPDPPDLDLNLGVDLNMDLDLGLPSNAHRGTDYAVSFDDAWWEDATGVEFFDSFFFGGGGGGAG